MGRLQVLRGRGGIAEWNARKAATRMVRPLRGRHLPEEGATPERDIGARSATAIFPALPDRRSALSLAQHFRAPPFRREIDKAGGSQSRHPFAPLAHERQNRAFMSLPVLACGANQDLLRPSCDHPDFCNTLHGRTA
ncbi:hypothetical protein [Nitrosospira sp. Nsp18]|uniref:hypothetical protein n=1 Tax=Nitrosospira sp. Nsp18 TaxID=1855334 RepID=UPI000B825BBC|nr:hypothetical protein [Nitrosospira sp. Nsp18]